MDRQLSCAVEAVTYGLGDDVPQGQDVVESLRTADYKLRCKQSAACVLRISSGNFQASYCEDKGYEITVMTNIAQTTPLK